MDYKEKYEKAVKAAMLAKQETESVVTVQTLEEIFPELRESEDERIRKELIDFVKSRLAGFPDCKRFTDWLEKQCDKVSAIEGFETEFERQVSGLIASAINKEHEYNEGYVKWTANALLNYAKHEIEKKGEKKSIDDLTPQEAMDIAVAKCFEEGEQKPADKVEPKFEVGDWISGYYTNYKVTAINSEGYAVEDTDGNKINILFENEKFHHLWTIQDAKDGDVLIDKSGSRECPFIFKETKPSDIKTDMLNPLAVLGYCGIGGAGFTKGSGWGDTANCIYYPATKEQREQLEKAMADAGYEWDAEKREPKKIEHNPAWSEDDEVKINRIVACLENLNVADNDILLKDIDWLKSLKERVQPQPKQEWSEEDENTRKKDN